MTGMNLHQGQVAPYLIACPCKRRLRALQIEFDELVADGRGCEHAQVGKQQRDEGGRGVVNYWMLLVEVLCSFQGVRFILRKERAGH